MGQTKVERVTGRELHRFYEAMMEKEWHFCLDPLCGDKYGGVTGSDDDVFALDLDTEYELEKLGYLRDDMGDEGPDVKTQYNTWLKERRLADPRRQSPRYPHTYADDLLRILVNRSSDGVKMTRTQSRTVRDAVAAVLDDTTVAEKFADYYLEHEQELVAAALDSIMGDVG